MHIYNLILRSLVLFDLSKRPSHLPCRCPIFPKKTFDAPFRWIRDVEAPSLLKSSPQPTRYVRRRIPPPADVVTQSCLHPQQPLLCSIPPPSTPSATPCRVASRGVHHSRRQHVPGLGIPHAGSCDTASVGCFWGKTGHERGGGRVSLTNKQGGYSA